MLKRHAEFLAFLALWSYVLAVIFVQLGIKHGREMQQQEDRIAVESMVLDESVWPLPTDSQVKKKRDCAVLADALLAAGWNVQLIPTMLAISRAEAGCNPLARQTTMFEDSRGALQLNLRAHPWVNRWCSEDVFCSARAALRIYEQQGLRAWTSYRTASYRQHLEVHE